jgi:hypothetical protein
MEVREGPGDTALFWRFSAVRDSRLSRRFNSSTRLKTPKGVLSFRFIEENGGRSRIRTYDPLIKSQLLYQLSYAPARSKQ